MNSDLPTGHVHHIDGDQENNLRENLVTLCWGCHNDRHDHYVPDGVEDTSVYGLRGEDSPNWDGGRYEDVHGYIMVKRPDHPNADTRGYIGEHRLVASNKIGRPLEDGEVVHHKNEDPTDNRPENLEVLTIAEHMVRHRGEDSDLRKPGEPNPEIGCACGCGETLKKYDEDNRPREYIVGHHSREQEAPTQDAILEILKQRGETKRIDIIETLDKTVSAVKSALEELEEKGKVEKGEGRGMWNLAIEEVLPSDD